MSIDVSGSSITNLRNRLSVFLKCLQLLYRLGEQKDEADNKNYLQKNGYVKLIKAILDIYKPLENFTISGGESESIEKVRDLILTYMNDDTKLNRELIVQNLTDILKDNNKKDFAVDMFKEVKNDADNQSMIKAIEYELNKITNINKVKKFFNDYTYDFDKKLKGGASIDEILDRITEEAQILKKNIKKLDLAIVNEVDLDNISSVASVFQTVKETSAAESTKFKLGLQALNRLTNDGYKAPEFTIWNALQHNYKSGMLASGLIGMARYNTPIMIDPNKIPLLLYVSLEDDLDILFEFLYRQMYYTDNKVKANMDEVSKEEMAAFVKDKLQATGFKVKFIKVDPSDWSFHSFFNLVESYENEGYEIKAVTLDYLSLIPTVGCNNTGTPGSDLRDLYRRVRNFFGKRKCSFISAHQLSPDATMLAREGLDGEKFLNRIMGKGFFDGSKKLSQEMDLELYAYKYTKDGKDYLAIGKGKHKGSKVMRSQDKIAIIPFPENLEPIPDDIMDESQEYSAVASVSKEIKGLIGMFEALAS